MGLFYLIFRQPNFTVLKGKNASLSMQWGVGGAE